MINLGQGKCEYSQLPAATGYELSFFFRCSGLGDGRIVSQHRMIKT